MPKSHFQEVHPDYWKWFSGFNRKLLVTEALVFGTWGFTGLSAYGIIHLGISDSVLGGLFFGSFLPFIIAIIFLSLTWHRFHKEWLIHHPGFKEQPGYRLPRLAVEGVLIVFAGFLAVTFSLAFHTIAFSIVLFLAGSTFLIFGSFVAVYGRFHGPSRGRFQRPNFHWKLISGLGALSLTGSIVYLGFLAPLEVVSLCNKDIGSSLGCWLSVIFFLGVPLLSALACSSVSFLGSYLRDALMLIGLA